MVLYFPLFFLITMLLEDDFNDCWQTAKDAWLSIALLKGF